MDPDGDGIKDYQFELSRRPDMRFPLSMSFYKLSSRTPDASRKWTGHGFEFSDVKPQYTLNEAGLLTPDTRLIHPFRDPVLVSQAFLGHAPEMGPSATIPENDSVGSHTFRLDLHAALVWKRERPLPGAHHGHLERLDLGVIAPRFGVLGFRCSSWHFVIRSSVHLFELESARSGSPRRSCLCTRRLLCRPC